MNHADSIALWAAHLDHGGVADHVYSLAQELRKQGARVITLDRGTGNTTVIRSQCDDAGIEWIGLHFVSYGWAKNGVLSRRDINEIARACETRRIAIYFHELWIGESRNDSFKHRLIGWFQRQRLLQMIEVLKPNKVFTSNPVYQTLLQRHGVASSILPLPGNIPIASDRDKGMARQWLSEHGIKPEDLPVVIFGTIHPEWDPEAALLSWCEYQRQQHRPAVLVTLGKHGPAGLDQLSNLKSRIPQLKIVSTGEQSAEMLAGLLSFASFGIATTPWALIGKSGSVAAFLEAGLPVLVTRDDWQCRSGATPAPNAHPQLWKWKHDSPFDWSAFLSSHGSPNRIVEAVVKVWLNLIHPTKAKQ